MTLFEHSRKWYQRRLDISSVSVLRRETLFSVYGFADIRNDIHTGNWHVLLEMNFVLSSVVVALTFE